MKVNPEELQQHEYFLEETKAMIGVEIAKLFSLGFESTKGRDLNNKGDFTSNIAFKLSKIMEKPPQEIAGIICKAISKRRTFSWYWDKAEAKNGFINLYLSKEMLIANMMNIKNEVKSDKD